MVKKGTNNNQQFLATCVPTIAFGSDDTPEGTKAPLTANPFTFLHSRRVVRLFVSSCLYTFSAKTTTLMVVGIPRARTNTYKGYVSFERLTVSK